MNEQNPFEPGGRYRNRGGDYLVLAIDGNLMTVRYDGGREQTLNVETQARIWRNMLDDELAAARRSDFTKDDFDADERLVTWPVRQLVEQVLVAEFMVPYPPDIIDRVCLAIEANPNWLSRYHTLAAELGDASGPAAWKVNNAIGWWTKDLAGMVTVKPNVRATSGLIKSYSRLGYPEGLGADPRRASYQSTGGGGSPEPHSS